MKSLVVVLLVLAILLLAAFCSSCASVSFESVPKFDNLTQINEWISSNIAYDAKFTSFKEAESVSQTIVDRTANCVEQCNLFKWFALETGYSGIALIGVQYDGINHLIIDAGSSGYFDPTNGTAYGYKLPKGWKIIYTE